MGLEKDRSTSLRDPGRVAAARRTGLLDGPPDAALDRLTRLAARLLRCPAGLLCLVTEDRLFVVSASGAPDSWSAGRDLPLDQSFCQHAIATRSALVVEDARAEESLRASPAVAEMGVVAYVGVPLLDPDGRALGTLCVADTAPRRWTEAELSDLHDLAAIADGGAAPPARRERGAGAGSGGHRRAAQLRRRPGDDLDRHGRRHLRLRQRPLARVHRPHPAAASSAAAGPISSTRRTGRRYLEQFGRAVAQREPLRLEYRVRRQRRAVPLAARRRGAQLRARAASSAG